MSGDDRPLMESAARTARDPLGREYDAEIATRDEFERLCREAAAAAKLIASRTPLERRRWAIEKMVALVENPARHLAIRVAALKLLVGTEKNVWDKIHGALPLFQPGDVATTADEEDAALAALERDAAAEGDADEDAAEAATAATATES